MSKLDSMLNSLLNEVATKSNIDCFENSELAIEEFETLIANNGERKYDEVAEIAGVKYGVFIDGFSKDQDYYFVSPDVKGNGYDLMVSIYEDGGADMVTMVCKNPRSKVSSAAKLIYIHYFVDKFGELYSDEVQTPEGFSLWKRIFKYVEKKDEYVLGVVNFESSNFDIQVLDTVEEMQNYYGGGYENFRFVVSRI